MNALVTPEVLLAWTRLVRVGRSLLAEVENDLKRAGFPPLAWYDVLHALDAAPDGSQLQSAMQARVAMAQYNLCRLVDRLEREGLLQRHQCPKDGRNNVLAITAKGRELRRNMWPIYAQSLGAHVGAQLETAEATELARLLGRLVPDPHKA